ncbi:MAG: hypothetical protein OXO56_06695 [Gammaproteobacteria bacterium]|nr:hypothetical protein [Gammaproteobacteria bacterium]
MLVTGGDGHVASWVVGRFLEVGLNVHATAGDPDDPRGTAKLNALARDSSGMLCFIRAALTRRRPAGTSW